MHRRRLTALVVSAALLSGCGGGGAGSVVTGSGGGTSGGGVTGVGPGAATCSLLDRQNWVAGQIREWYLFPETLPASLDPAPYASVDDYVDALTAMARAQRRDRFFTYVTSIAAENAFFERGESAGFGFRLATDAAAREVLISETFEGTPALAAGIDRGARILAIGTNNADLRAVDQILASEGSFGITRALGPDTPGTTRVFRISDAQGTREVQIAKADYALSPVSSRYGVRVIDDGGRRVGYVNLRTFISTADPQLRAAFGSFRQQGITEIIVDVRYNGGGLVSTAELVGDLMGAGRSTSDIFNTTRFRPEKAAENNRIRYFRPLAESIAPTRVAFIGTRGSASASELVINAAIPYLGTNMALVGTNTFGKPVGQIALDRPTCDDRLRVVAFDGINANNQGAYYDGLASTVPVTCQAADDLSRPLGDPQEASTRQALDYLAGRSCTPIGANASLQMSRSAAAAGERRLELMRPERPSAMQHEVPGAF